MSFSVFNHTVLEHVFDVFTAFSNLCALARDAVIVVLPFMQEQHGEYGDYWRFTPSCIKRLFELNGMTLAYSNWNDGRGDAVYVFAVGVRDPSRWSQLANWPSNRLVEVDQTFIGRRVIKGPPMPVRVLRALLSRRAGGRTGE